MVVDQIPTIHIEIHTKTTGSRKLSFSSSPVTFGRNPDNDIVLLNTAVSREHGELRYENGQWQLFNLSANGSRLSNRRVTKKPREVSDGDEVGVEDTALFRISLAAAPASARPSDHDADAIDEEEESTSPAAGGMSKRNKIWIGVGTYLLILVGLGVVLALMPSSDGPSGSIPREMADEAIVAEIRQEITRQSDPLRAQERLREARELFHRQDASPDALFRAHRAFKESLAYSGQQQFTQGIDQQLFMEAERLLIEAVRRQYRDANALAAAGDFQGADRAFAQLQELYDDPSSAFYSHIDQQRAAVRRRASAGR